ncbi:AGR113Wp [Eremothecium gossypii ATCC 10895]|uniref:RNA helicase n=1 Tax=Eremothecium gossypii (strain ATCC 10895 / CBS 109.51 / FGSC 9923 / NRRL Y-1056) TaxID=284811 RepID=Q74ZT5_EREGS|nr:AGR113Wp [Eremothecium gossypii ATCC 10895]AAS54603.1 AGR113Wp [Eremothecium gossypii ATCC 10895]
MTERELAGHKGSMSENAYDERKRKIREVYRYDEMSSKVLRADRRLQENTSDPMKDAALSQPRSMAGKISVKEMGQRSAGTVPEEERERAVREIARKEVGKRAAVAPRDRGRASVLSHDIESLKYYPSTEQSRAAYEDILGWVSALLGDDLPRAVILSATDLVIQLLKEDEATSDHDMKAKKELLERDLATSIAPSEFHELVNMSKRIQDYTEGQMMQRDESLPVGEDSEPEEDEPENPLLAQIEVEEEEADVGDLDDLGRENQTDQPGDSTGDILEFQGTKATKHSDLDLSMVDEHYVDRKLAEVTGTPMENVRAITADVLKSLEAEVEENELKAALGRAIGPQYEDLIAHILNNRHVLRWGSRLARAGKTEVDTILAQMSSSGQSTLAEEYRRALHTGKRRSSVVEAVDSPHKSEKKPKFSLSEDDNLLDLSALTFEQGSALLTSTKVLLPDNSFKRIKSTHEEIHIPAPPKPVDNFPLVSISSLVDWAQKSFPTAETKTLNRIQSEVYPIAFGTDKNMLLCAPTGAGKTNVAVLAILRLLSKYYKAETKSFNTSKFKVVYIAPLKALVQEQVREFQRRLQQYGLKVAELTGDSNLTRQQIMEAQILVSTPEKWDVITRNGLNRHYTKLVQLLIIDEVHLLHDERGPVIESIVARLETQGSTETRVVALSATLPNYTDIAEFLRVPSDGLFYFDASFRPCPLAQQFCGITETNSVKRVNAMNQVCYEKVLESVAENHQVIVFVHSRKDTARTAIWLRDKLLEEDKISSFAPQDAGSAEILKRETENITDKSFGDVVQHGFGIHHAGLSRDDRSLAEDLFADGLIKVLVSTSTLAWGVNLPAHTVIIKGTEMYSPQKGSWVSLSSQEVLQMLGRAGRPRYDTFGEGIIITNQSNIHYFLAILNQQLPIESQFISKLPDNANAEIVLGTVKNRIDIVDWLGNTYLYVRMLKDPKLYKVADEIETDAALLSYRERLAHAALRLLHENNLIVYNPVTGDVQSTDLGRIASQYYISYTTIATYNGELNMHLDQMDILRLFAKSDEFKYVSARQEERNELANLLERAPIPIQEDSSSPLAKVNVLLQSYISRLKLDGFALNADMIYITQNAGRIFRALFEISLRKGWSRLLKVILNLCKSIEKRMWLINTPFRQFPSCPIDVIRRTEASSLPWIEYLALDSPAEVAQAIRSEKYGKAAYDLLKKFPKLKIECSVQPITPSLLKFSLEVNADWDWDSRLHGYAETFILLVEDTDGESILHTDKLTIYKDNSGEPHLMDFSVQLDHSKQINLPPNYFISLISDKWLHCDNKVPVVLTDIHLPRKFPPHTRIEERNLIETSELDPTFSGLFPFKVFNKFQTHVFNALYHTDENVFIGACKGSGKTAMAELALLSHWRDGKGRAVYICPSQEKIDFLVKDWRNRFLNVAGGKVINKLTLELTNNLRTLAQSHLILATPEQFDLLSRRWKRRKNIQTLELLILDDLHMISSDLPGARYENIISRMLFIRGQLETALRIVGLSTSLANGRDVGEWLGAKKATIFNFSFHERVMPLQIHLQSFHKMHEESLIETMAKSAFLTVQNSVIAGSSVMLFVPSRKNCVHISVLLATAAAGTEYSLRPQKLGLETHLPKVEDGNLRESLKHGIGFFYHGMSSSDKAIVEQAWKQKLILCIAITRDLCVMAPFAETVIIMGTQYYEPREHRYVNYPVADVLEIVGTAQGNADYPGKVILMTTHDMKAYYKNFLNESLPTESYMLYYLHDGLINDIATSVIESKQDCVDWITFTYFYRRIHANPSFYGVKDTSPLGISAYLTGLVQDTLDDLVDSSIIEITNPKEDENEDEQILPLNGCMISSHHNVSFQTMHMFMQSLSRSTKLKSIIEILASASEYEDIPMRQEDYDILRKIHANLPYQFSAGVQNELPSFKVFVLLQTHFSRIKLNKELTADMNNILAIAVPLVNGITDILSGDGRLSATTAMDLLQMLIQGCWDTDSPLVQVPSFNKQILKKCAEYKVETVYDIMALEDDERDNILSLPMEELNKVALFVNSYPNIELHYEMDSSVPVLANEPQQIRVTVTRDEEPESLAVVSERFPHEKLENWWIFVGETATRQLYSIRKVALSKESQTYTLDVAIPNSGKHVITVWCICDSYVDADKEVSFEVYVQP